ETTSMRYWLKKRWGASSRRLRPRNCGSIDRPAAIPSAALAVISAFQIAVLEGVSAEISRDLGLGQGSLTAPNPIRQKTPVHAVPLDSVPEEHFPSGEFETAIHRFPSSARPQRRVRRPAAGARLRVVCQAHPRRGLESAREFPLRE